MILGPLLISEVEGRDEAVVADEDLGVCVYELRVQFDVVRAY